MTSSALSLSQGFPPFLDLPATTFRYRTSDQNLVAGQTISIFQDSSGNGNNLTAYGNPLITNVSSTGGKNFLACNFDGTDDRFVSNTNALAVNGYSQYILASVSTCDNSAFTPKDPPENCLLIWAETGSWGTVNLAPFQSAVMTRYGTGQGGNLPSYTRPTSIGNALTATTWVKNGATEYLYVDGNLVATYTGKLTTIANTEATLNVGFSKPNANPGTYYKGVLVETFGIAGKADSETIAKVNSYLKSFL